MTNRTQFYADLKQIYIKTQIGWEKKYQAIKESWRGYVLRRGRY